MEHQLDLLRNSLRMIADMLHLLSFIILIVKILRTKDCSGISYKTQEIYLVVFVARYWDLFLYWISYYNTIMKLLYISSTLLIIVLIRVVYKETYDRESDGFPHFLLYPAAFGLMVAVKSFWEKLVLDSNLIDLYELSWAFSIWLESLAIIPQLYLLHMLKVVERWTGHYVAALGFYRLFYLLKWFVQYSDGYLTSWTSVLGGVLQTIIYGDFLYHYIRHRKSGVVHLSDDTQEPQIELHTGELESQSQLQRLQDHQEAL